jgi:hypothetical protein
LTVASIAQPHTTTLANPIEAQIASFDRDSSLAAKMLRDVVTSNRGIS